mgnify:CR=1 FL=1
MKTVYHVGLDVHKETVEMSVFKNRETEPEYEQKMNNEHRAILSHLRRLQERGEVQVCYEAGCMGFILHRTLREAGIECRIIAPGKVPRRPGERIKTDRRDARNLAKLLRAGDATGIHVPTEEDEATRDYLRAREDVKLELKRAKQQMQKFLLRLGHRYETKRYWTGAHWKWMHGISFSQPMHQETFATYCARIRELENRIALMEDRIVEIARSERYRDMVDLLRCFKGIDYLIALALVCEVGDFRRFPSAASFMAYLGLVPREHSSGEKRRQGGITKSGNGHLRRLLVESGWHYRYVAPPSKALISRRMGRGAEVIAYADKALRRLQRKFSRMLFKGKSSNAAVTAVARELAGFIWGMMNDKIA